MLWLNFEQGGRRFILLYDVAFDGVPRAFFMLTSLEEGKLVEKVTPYAVADVWTKTTIEALVKKYDLVKMERFPSSLKVDEAEKGGYGLVMLIPYHGRHVSISSNDLKNRAFRKKYGTQWRGFLGGLRSILSTDQRLLAAPSSIVLDFLADAEKNAPTN